jgi:hypothetical protein
LKLASAPIIQQVIGDAKLISSEVPSHYIISPRQQDDLLHLDLLAGFGSPKSTAYNPAGDRRRKAHTAELLNFRIALYRMAVKLRSGTPEEISRLIWEIQNLPTDQDLRLRSPAGL